MYLFSRFKSIINIKSTRLKGIFTSTKLNKENNSKIKVTSDYLKPFFYGGGAREDTRGGRRGYLRTPRTEILRQKQFPI